MLLAIPMEADPDTRHSQRPGDICSITNLFYLQAISLPSSGDRGAVSYNFGLSASEDGGPNKQSSQNLLRATNG